MRVAVVGATGMVGEVMLQVLAERNFPVTELIPVASEKSVGKKSNLMAKNGCFALDNQIIKTLISTAKFWVN